MVAVNISGNNQVKLFAQIDPKVFDKQFQFSYELCKVSVAKIFHLFFAGCCFVTFYTRKAALEAQNAMHNIKTLPGVSFDPQKLATRSSLLAFGPF